MKPKEFGKEGERLAARFLEEKGYSIIETNFQKRIGEIDLVAFDPQRNETVFVEVKSRRNRAFGTPEEAITPRKLEKMAGAAELWLQEKGINDSEWRLDLVAIECPRNQKTIIRHIENLG